ncbi:glycosyl hydrolase family 28-related protein [Streptomyces bicolor]|uniref:glycosyl hydrolase family 28-related protein n=1 Tax=Streptomyces bicolor TaxID=66874 RepID=UPI0004E1F9BC|nr:glycosyl hydrolase family 28-related protein [Streptomyces bicolor]
MSMLLTVDAQEHGLVGDGTTNDRPALAKLVDTLGAACEADGQPRVIRVPPGRYVIRDQGVVWRSGVSLIGADRGATCFVLCNPDAPTTPVPPASRSTARAW